MPTMLGDTTRTLFLKSESHKLHEAFTVKELTATLTVSTDLITANSTIVTVNGNSTTATVYATDHDTTMAAIAAKVAALPGVASASAATTVITYQMTDQTTAPIGSAVTTAGSTQPTWTAATDVNTIKKGMPVKLTTDGELEPAADGENPINIIGYSLHNGFGGEVVTVAMKAYAIVFAEAYAASHNAGPVVYKSTSSTTNRQIYDDASVTYANIAGWSLDAQASANGTIRVALFS